MELRDIKKALRSLSEDGFAKTAEKARRRSRSTVTADYARWIAAHEPTELTLRLQRTQPFAYEPRISFITPACNTRPAFAKELIQSVLAQTYPRWELVIADGSDNAKASRTLASLSARDRRIKYVQLGENRGITGNSMAAVKYATGDVIAFLDHDDSLAPFACYELVKAINAHPEAELLYSDEDKFDNMGRFDPHFKPEASPDTLLSYNYITHLMAMTKGLYDRCGGLRAGYEGSQDHDLALRALAAAKETVHIPKVLYHWRAHSGSVAGNGKAKTYADSSGLRAVNAATAASGAFAVEGLFPHSYRARYPFSHTPRVSVIIPNRDKPDMLAQCLEGLRRTCDGIPLEVILMENGSTLPETFSLYSKLERQGEAKVIRCFGEFNYSSINDLGASEATGELLLFLNNDVIATDPGWLTAMAEQALRPAVGAVGAKLLYPDGRIQHAGVVVGMNGWADHVCAGAEADGGGRFACSHLVNTIRNVSAVTGACLMIQKRKFEEVGGFSTDFKLCGGDVELCLRLLQQGYRNIYTPYATLLHLESATRKDDPIPEQDFRHSKKAYAPYAVTGDPYYSRNYDYMSNLPKVTT